MVGRRVAVIGFGASLEKILSCLEIIKAVPVSNTEFLCDF